MSSLQDYATYHLGIPLTGPSISATKQNPRSGRMRTAQACDRCKFKKTKCNGLKPTCGTCAQSHYKCHYSTRKTRTSKAQPPYKPRAPGTHIRHYIASPATTSQDTLRSPTDIFEVQRTSIRAKADSEQPESQNQFHHHSMPKPNVMDLSRHMVPRRHSVDNVRISTSPIASTACEYMLSPVRGDSNVYVSSAFPRQPPLLAIHIDGQSQRYESELEQQDSPSSDTSSASFGAGRTVSTGRTDTFASSISTSPSQAYAPNPFDVEVQNYHSRGEYGHGTWADPTFIKHGTYSTSNPVLCQQQALMDDGNLATPNLWAMDATEGQFASEFSGCADYMPVSYADANALYSQPWTYSPPPLAPEFWPNHGWHWQ